MAVSNPTQFVSVPFEELKNLMEMARGVAKRSPFGTVDTQPWNPDMTVLPELGNSLPTIAGVVGETNTILISLPDLELIIGCCLLSGLMVTGGLMGKILVFQP